MTQREEVERWLTGRGPRPHAYTLSYWLIDKLEEIYPERRSQDGELLEEAGTPPSHAWIHRVALEIASEVAI